jgi:hypothetical protein
MFQLTLFTETSDGNSRLLSAHDEIGVVLGHDKVKVSNREGGHDQSYMMIARMNDTVIFVRRDVKRNRTR